MKEETLSHLSTLAKRISQQRHPLVSLCVSPPILLLGGVIAIWQNCEPAAFVAITGAFISLGDVDISENIRNKAIVGVIDTLRGKSRASYLSEHLDRAYIARRIEKALGDGRLTSEEACLLLEFYDALPHVEFLTGMIGECDLLLEKAEPVTEDDKRLRDVIVRRNEDAKRSRDEYVRSIEETSARMIAAEQSAACRHMLSLAGQRLDAISIFNEIEECSDMTGQYRMPQVQ